MEKIIYKESSYKIVGILYEVYNELGYGFKEIYYERAIRKCFVEKGIKFKEQIPFRLSFKGKVIGTFYLDFLVDNSIILEIKKGKYFSKKNIEQVNECLKITGRKLAIIANFTPSGVNFKRIINIK